LSGPGEFTLSTEEREELLEVIARSSRTSLQLALAMLRNGREVPGRIDAKLRGLKGARSAPREEDMDRDRYLAYAEARILYGKGWGAGDGAETAEAARPDQKDLQALLERGTAAEAGSWVREGRSHLLDEADRENEERMLGAVAKADPETGLEMVRDCCRRGWEVNGGVVRVLWEQEDRHFGWTMVETLRVYGRAMPEGVGERLGKTRAEEMKRVLEPILSGGKG
jgi:hypothetical protein